MQNNDVLIIASGGGHTGFARAIAEYLSLSSNSYKVDFVIPENDKYSEEALKPFSSQFYYVKKAKEPNQGNIALITNLPHVLAQSLKIKKYKVVIATGSNHSLFPALAQRAKGSKLFVIESQDRIVTRGKIVSILSNFAENVFLHWQEQKGLYPKKGMVVGPIVEKPKYTPKDEGYVLVTTGTMGFKRLFDIVVSLDLGKEVVIQTGRVPPEQYAKRGVRAFSFSTELEKYISEASLVITHQGKTAMESVVMYKKPTIVVYNKDWRYAATKEDSKRYAEILGATFLDDPSQWDSVEELTEAIKKVKPPKKYEIGTPNLVKRILEELS